MHICNSNFRRHEGHVYSSPLASYTKAGVPKCVNLMTFLLYIQEINNPPQPIKYEIQRQNRMRSNKSPTSRNCNKNAQSLRAWIAIHLK